ncbi:MAG: hypothetical protein JNM56_31040, partial [Planctomycetia bacterium]|nr:hypothetical protein [Planctomycetia bacterium]
MLSRFKPAVRRSACPPRRPKPPAFRPGLELLESRDCPSYLPAVDLAVGPSPGAVATWQQDLSGPSALAVTHMADNRVSVVRGNADGTFQAPVAYAVGEAPHAIAAAVSNLTGRAVLVTANAGANSVSVLWENGDGTFQDAVHYAVGQAPGAVALGDLNWDGCFDIAVANAGDDTVSVLLGNANGTFQSARSYTVGSAPSSILLTWMNQPSLVVANAGDNTITVLQADFMGNLFASGTYQVGRNPQALAAGYFGGSGVGIAVANADDGTVSVLAGNWNGTLNEKVDHVVGGEPRALALVSSYTGSLLLVADAADHTVRRFSVQTDGSLQLEEVASVGQQPTALATLPLTFGNQLAIVVAHEEGDSVSLLSVPQFAVRPVSAVRAGEPFAVEISIRNALGQLVTDFAGSVVLRTSDPWAEPLATVNFSVADQGARVLDIAPLTVAGNQYLYLFTVEAGVETLQTTASVLVQPGPTVRLSLDHFGVPSAYAEQPFSLRVAGLDAFGNFDFNYTGTVTITSSDAPATLPVSVTFGPEHGGVQYVEVVFATTGAQTITISDTNGLTAALHLDVGPPLPTQLSIVAPNQVEAGETFALTVTLLDRFGQPATDFTGTVWISSSDWLAFPAQPYTFTAADQGMHTFEGLVLQVAGWQQVSASFGVDAVFLQASATVVVAALPATRFNVQSVGTVQVGQPALFGLSAQDLFGNIDANYAGTVWLTGDAPDAQLPAELELSPADGGARTFEITFATAGTHTLTVTDAHGLTGSLTVTVAGMPAERIEFALPSQVRAGETFEFTVSIVDALGRVVPDFLGFVMFTSETSRAELPDSYTFTETDQGRHTFSARLNQAGQATVNVMGLGEQWLMASATVAVLPGPVVGLEVVGMPARLSVGQLGEIAVRAVDAGGNTVTDYVGTIAFTSSDPLAQLPPPYTFTVGDQGRHTFVVSLFSQSAQRVGFTTTDGFSWEQTAIQVTPDPTNFAADRLATALPVPFGPSGIVSLSGHLATGRDVLLYALDLQAGETITAAIDTQAPASALDGVLRVFDASGRCLASNDNLVGKDARLTFQAATTGTFYVGVSSSGNREYDPTLAQSGALGTTTGGFTLHLTRDLAPLLPDLVGTSCAIREPAVWGETIIVDYLLENRGGSDAGPFRVDVRLSADNRIDATDMLLGSFSVGGLAAGTASNGSLQLRLPADGAGRFPEAGRFFVGLALDADNSVVELDERNNSSQTLGNDQALLTVFAIAPESTAGQPTVLPSLARVDGQLAAGAAD